MEALKNISSGTLAIIFWIASATFLIGNFQFFYTYLDWWAIFAALPSLITSRIPIVGSVLATVTAVQIWKWDPFVAVLFNFWPYILILVMLITSLIMEYFQNSKNKNHF